MFPPVSTARPTSKDVDPRLRQGSSRLQQTYGADPGAGAGQLAARAWLADPPNLWADLACYSAALLAVVLQGPLAAHQYALTDALKLRISLENVLVAGLCLLLWAVFLRTTSARGQGTNRNAGLLLGLVTQVSLATGIVAVLLILRHRDLARPAQLAMFFVLSLLLLLCYRLMAGGWQTLVQPAMRKERTVLIVGAGRRGRQLAEQLAFHPKWNYRVHGFIDPDATMNQSGVLGTLESLESELIRNPIEEVIITLPVRSLYNEIQEAIAICERVGTQSRYSSDLFETSVTKRRSTDQHDPSSVLLHMVHDTGLVLKRATDIAVAATGLILLSPLFLVIAIGIKLTSSGPVFFRQQRYGLNRRLFTMYKFRSMIVDAEQQQAKLEHMNETNGPVFKIKKDPRITGIGSFLRKTSLDELPQLWNVLIGNMSLVGPRPLPIRDVSRFSDASLMRRFSVPPGITGLWQVSGRSNTSFAHWIKLDLDYIDRWSLMLDLKILAMTFSVVLRREGAA